MRWYFGPFFQMVELQQFFPPGSIQRKVQGKLKKIRYSSVLIFSGSDFILAAFDSAAAAAAADFFLLCISFWQTTCSKGT